MIMQNGIEPKFPVGTPVRVDMNHPPRTIIGIVYKRKMWNAVFDEGQFKSSDGWEYWLDDIGDIGFVWPEDMLSELTPDEIKQHKDVLLDIMQQKLISE